MNELHFRILNQVKFILIMIKSQNQLYRDAKQILYKLSICQNYLQNILKYMHQAILQISSSQPRNIFNMNSNKPTALYIRAGNKKTVLEKFIPPISVEKIAKTIQRKFNVPISEQLIYSRGQKLQLDSKVNLQQKSIIHFVDRRQTILQNISFTIRRPDQKQTHTFNIQANTNINDFIKDQLYNIYFMESNNLFLVYLGRELDKQKSFFEQQVENGAQIACLHVLFNLKRTEQVQNLIQDQKNHSTNKKLKIEQQFSQISNKQKEDNNPFRKKQQKVQNILNGVQYEQITINNKETLQNTNQNQNTQMFQWEGRDSLSNNNQNFFDNLQNQTKHQQLYDKNPKILIQQNQSVQNSSSMMSYEREYFKNSNEQYNNMQSARSSAELDLDVRRSLSKAADQSAQKIMTVSHDFLDTVHASISDKNNNPLISPCQRNSIYQITMPEFIAYKSLNSEIQYNIERASKSSYDFNDSVHASISELHNSISPCQRNSIYQIKYCQAENQQQNYEDCKQPQNLGTRKQEIQKTSHENLNNIYDKVEQNLRKSNHREEETRNADEDAQQKEQQQQQNIQIMRSHIITEVKQVQSIQSSEKHSGLNTISQKSQYTSQMGNSIDKNFDENQRKKNQQTSSLSLQRNVSEDVWQKKDHKRDMRFKSEIRNIVEIDNDHSNTPQKYKRQSLNLDQQYEKIIQYPQQNQKNNSKRDLIETTQMHNQEHIDELIQKPQQNDTDLINPYSIIITTFEDIIKKKDNDIKEAVDIVLGNITNRVENKLQQQYMQQKQQQSQDQQYPTSSKILNDEGEEKNIHFYKIQYQEDKQESIQTPIFPQNAKNQYKTRDIFTAFQPEDDDEVGQTEQYQQKYQDIAQDNVQQPLPKPEMKISIKKNMIETQEMHKYEDDSEPIDVLQQDSPNKLKLVGTIDYTEQQQNNEQNQQNKPEDEDLLANLQSENQQIEEQNDIQNQAQQNSQQKDMKIKLTQEIIDINQYLNDEDMGQSLQQQKDSEPSLKSISLGAVQDENINQQQKEAQKAFFGYIGQFPQNIEQNQAYQPFQYQNEAQNNSPKNFKKKNILSDSSTFTFTNNEILFPISSELFNKLSKQQSPKKTETNKIDRFLFEDDNLLDEDNKQNSKDLQMYLYDRQNSENDYEQQ